MKFIITVALVCISLWLGACGPIGNWAGSLTGQAEDSSSDAAADYVFESSDLALFELHHRVKRVTTTTYYDVTPVTPDSVTVDTLPDHRIQTVVYFDTLGHYLARRDERITRDDLGRIIRWDDRRPNLRRVHGGFLRDTLTYRHISPNVVTSSGMGDFAVTVYDDRSRIVGQYTDPLSAPAPKASTADEPPPRPKRVTDTNTAVFNIYRAEDSHGNWTERLSVWTTQAPDSRPHISYTLERRTITYY